MENEETTVYEDRILHVEHGCFSPLVFSTAEGLGPSATMAYIYMYKHLPSFLVAKLDDHYTHVVR